MIKIVVNGKERILKNDISVYEFLLQNGYKIEFVAIERDMKILNRDFWQKSMMSQGRRYEIVEFVGGG